MAVRKKVRLGDKVRDKTSGLEGIAYAECTYLHGCKHIGIQGPVRDGRIPPLQWVDEPQAEIIQEPKKAKKAKVSSLFVKRKGGPAPGGSPGRKQHPQSDWDDESDNWRGR